MEQHSEENLKTQLTEYLYRDQEKFYRVAYSYVKDKDTAFDVIQEAIVKALNKIHSLREPNYMRTWFYRILINESITALRKSKRQFPAISELPDTPCTDRDPTEFLDITNAIDQLDPKLKTIILLRFFEDMKLEEIAQITKTNLSTVKSRLYRALNQLKTLLGEEEIL